MKFLSPVSGYVCDECGALIPHDDSWGDRDKFVRWHIDWHEKGRSNWHPFQGYERPDCAMCGRPEKDHDDQFKFPAWKQRQDAAWNKP